MKTLTLLIMTLLIQNRKVYCQDFFKTLSQSIIEVAKIVDRFFKRVKNVFVPSEKSAGDFLEKRLLEEKVKQSFNDFVGKTAADDKISEDFTLGSRRTAMMSMPQLATLHGRRIESHVIKTNDGYLLTLHRLINNCNPNNTKFSNATVLLHHGLLGSSADWILLGPEKSLPYILSDAGYDVWMANARGNYYSRGHITKQVYSDSYWNFTWQEMGEYDLPATIDYLRKIKTNTTEINFIGHSMGATALMVMLSKAPYYNEYLRIGILLAPLVFMTNTQGPFKTIMSMSSDRPSQLLKVIGRTEFAPSRKVSKMLTSKFCKGPIMYCSNPLLFLTGCIPNYNTEDFLGEEKKSFISRLLYHVPAGGSTNTVMHYGQLVNSGKFHRFDRISSEFPLHQVTLPIVLFSSSTDGLATVADTMRLYFSISNPIDHYVVRSENFCHTEFVWGENANVLVFPKLLEYLEHGLNISLVKENEI